MTLVGTITKHAIFIVEFSNERRERAGAKKTVPQPAGGG